MYDDDFRKILNIYLNYEDNINFKFKLFIILILCRIILIFQLWFLLELFNGNR